MTSKIFISMLILLLGFHIHIVRPDSSNCRRCMTNGGYCLDEKRYYKCHNNGVLPDISEMFECAENEVCTMQAPICIDRSEVNESTKACPESLGCNKCPEIYEWPPGLTCVSPTTYRVCEPEGINSSINDCRKDFLCSQQAYEQTGRICLPANVMQEMQYKVTCEKSDLLKYLARKKM